ncbi:MAG: helix-turn-helix transcriptional regulator [Eubacteriales bacterium]
MQNIMSKAGCVSYPPRISLNLVWHVKADNTYRVTHNIFDSGEFVALRTLSGQGTLKIHNSVTVTLPRDSLLIFKKGSVREYFCDGEQWEFFWLEFFGCEKDIPAAYNVFHIPQEKSEADSLGRCFTLLQSGREGSCVLSSSIFTAVLAGWNEHIAEISSPVREGMGHVMSYIARMPYDEISISTLARISGMPERTFRSLFKARTGMSPKEFIIQNKLDACFELLQTTDMQIKDIAQLQGFSNQYYFSRIFKKYYGYSPMKIRRYLYHT